MNIYLVHGLSAPRWVMHPLARMLKKHGHSIKLIGYQSRKLTVSKAADAVWETLAPKLDVDQPAVIITHSMGGLVMQQLLDRYKPKGIHCMIMIAPPNHGVELVTKFSKSFLTRWLLYVVGALPTHDLSKKIKPIAPNVCQKYTCHLINGITKKTISGTLIPGDNDGIVSIESTLIPNLASVTTLPYEHLVLILRRKTAATILKCIESA